MRQPASVAHDGSRPAKRGPLSLLLVEDSLQDAELISAWLAEGGLVFELTRVDSHAGFNQAISQRRFDLILSDYHVPGFDGMAALAAAHLACPEVPFLFVSGALGEERAIELLNIVESIVRAHGGSIEVRSTVDEGTRFTVRLPRSLHAARGG